MAGLPPAVNSPLFIWHYESKVSCPRTQRSAPARARTRTARSGVQRTNHQTTAPRQDCHWGAKLVHFRLEPKVENCTQYSPRFALLNSAISNLNPLLSEIAHNTGRAVRCLNRQSPTWLKIAHSTSRELGGQTRPFPTGTHGLKLHTIQPKMWGCSLGYFWLEPTLENCTQHRPSCAGLKSTISDWNGVK